VEKPCTYYLQEITGKEPVITPTEAFIV